MSKWSASTTPSRQLLADEELVSVADTERILSASRTTVAGLIASGDLATVKIGKRRLVRTESIRRLIEAGGTTKKEEVSA